MPPWSTSKWSLECQKAPPGNYHCTPVCSPLEDTPCHHGATFPNSGEDPLEPTATAKAFSKYQLGYLWIPFSQPGVLIAMNIPSGHRCSSTGSNRGKIQLGSLPCLQVAHWWHWCWRGSTWALQEVWSPSGALQAVWSPGRVLTAEQLPTKSLI